jgi:hypothetical protein
MQIAIGLISSAESQLSEHNNRLRRLQGNALWKAPYFCGKRALKAVKSHPNQLDR